MLQQNPALCYAIKTVHQLWMICLRTCNIFEVQCCNEWSASALNVGFCCQFLKKEPVERLVAPEAIRSHAFFKVIDWEQLQKKCVQPPIQPQIVKVSRTDSAIISCHMQLALRSEVSEGHNSPIARTLSQNDETWYVFCVYYKCSCMYVDPCTELVLLSWYRNSDYFTTWNSQHFRSAAVLYPGCLKVFNFFWNQVWHIYSFQMWTVQTVTKSWLSAKFVSRYIAP